MTDEEEFAHALQQVEAEAIAMANYDAYSNAKTPQEAMEVLTGALGVTVQEAVINLTHNALPHASQHALAELIITLWEEGSHELAQRAMERVSQLDFEERYPDGEPTPPQEP